MGNFIDSRCSIPVFKLTDSSLVKKCGRLPGYVISGMLTFFCIFVYIAITVFLNFSNNNPISPPTEEEKTNQDNIKQIITIVFICVLILIWVVIPISTGYLNVKQWEGYQYQINEFMNDGLSRKDALDKMQSIYNAQNIASSIRMGGHMYR